jgi:hypothetical protein
MKDIALAVWMSATILIMLYTTVSCSINVKNQRLQLSAREKLSYKIGAWICGVLGVTGLAVLALLIYGWIK